MEMGPTLPEKSLDGPPAQVEDERRGQLKRTLSASDETPGGPWPWSESGLVALLDRLQVAEPSQG